MSLEQALHDCTSAIHQLIAALGAQTSVAEVRAAGAPQPTVARDDNTYFHDAAHKVVYCVGPTEPLGTRSTLPRITRDEYLALKAEYEALTAAAIAASKAGPTGAAPWVAQAATSTPATSPTDVGNVQTPKVDGPAGGTATQGAAATPAGSTAAATVAATATTAEPVTWDKHVLPALQTLAKKPGDGGASLKSLLAAEGVAMVPPLKAKYVADYAPLLAKINAAQVH